jgi:cysteine desulfurase
MAEARQIWSNPASLHADGRAARELLEESRSKIARVLGAQTKEIIFTSGATESDNLAILGALTACGQANARIITLASEHAAARACMQVAFASGYDVVEAKIDETGMVNVADLRAVINDQTVLISVAMATSEIGTVQPIGEIGQLVRQIRAERKANHNPTPIIFHTDASNALGLLPLAVDRLGVDLMTISSAKAYGPAGIGALYVRRGTPLTPIIIGGRQESSLRSGTPAVELAAGFAAAATKAETMRKSEVKRLQDLGEEFFKGLKGISGVRLNGHKKKRLASVINLSFAGRDGEDLVLALDAAGFAVATGAACAESSDEPSHVLLAMGRTRAEAQSSLRISFGRDTSAQDVKKLTSAISKIVVE